jgi:hypothetical protein
MDYFRKNVINNKAIMRYIIYLTAFLFSITANSYETAEYKSLKKIGDFEARQYSPLVIATTSLSEINRKYAVKKGFKILYKYITGLNSKSLAIAMTTPVVVKEGDIPLVLGKSTVRTINWYVSFIMPKKHTLKTLPKPINKNIELLQFTGGKYLAVTFSGRNTKKNFDENNNKLKDFAKKNGYKVKGQPLQAFYNSPFTLPFLRRNEVIYKLAN